MYGTECIKCGSKINYFYYKKIFHSKQTLSLLFPLSHKLFNIKFSCQENDTAQY